MLAYVIRRIAGAVPTLFIIVAVSFFTIRLAPGGPFDTDYPVSAELRARLEAAYGLDRPMAVQFGRYLSGLVQGDFGPSLKFRDFTVTELIIQGFPVSLVLGTTALLLAVCIGVPLGVLAASRRSKVTDRSIMTLAAVAIAIPSFVVAPALALIFGLYLDWLPVAGWEAGDWSYFILPTVTLALPIAAALARLTRTSLLEVLSARYVRTARAKGLSERQIILHHALRPALLPVVSYLGPAVAIVLTGSLVVESVFALPGTGRYLVQGAINRDYPLVTGMVVIYGALTIVCNLVVDILRGWMDPQVRYD